MNFFSTKLPESSVDYFKRTFELLELEPQSYFQQLTKQEIFAKEAPLEIDLGCGDGSFLLAMAQQYPERNFLGIERLLGRVRKICRKAQQLQLTNLKVLRLESAYTVECLLPHDSISTAHLLFPDPWPKKKHHKRRLLTASFLTHLHKILKEKGLFLFKTDHRGYFENTLEIVDHSPLFIQKDWPSSLFYPKTDFEKLWLKEEKKIYRAFFTKT